MSEGLIVNPMLGWFTEPLLWEHPLKRDVAISSQFGEARGAKLHGGIDFPVRLAPVYAPAAGVVIRAEDWREETGLTVAIRQTDPVNVLHEVMHLDRLEPSIRPGVSVQSGQLLGLSGNTGFRWTGRGRERVAWHLHWQVRVPEVEETAALHRRLRALPASSANSPDVLRAWASLITAPHGPEQVAAVLHRLEGRA